MARSDQTNFLFEVLEGPFAGVVVTLGGRSLPYRAGAGGSISFGRTQRTKLTWYPGNQAASQQIIGPTVAPTTINGVWKERYLGEDAPIDLVELFEDLLDSGVQLRVSWQTIERRGIIKQFTWAPGDPVGGLTDIRWEMVLEWNSAAAIAPGDFTGQSTISLRDGMIRAGESIGITTESLQDFIENVGTFVGLPVRTFQATKTALESIIGALAAPLTTVSTTAARMGDEAALPNRLLEDAATAVASAQITGGDAGELVGNVSPISTTQADDLETIINEHLERAQIIDQTFDMIDENFEQRLRLEELIRPEAFTTIVPIIGQDLRELAIQFYGDADLWRRIANYNGIENSVVPNDVEELVIPLSLPDALDQGIGC